MLCESCGKNQANLHYTKIINGKAEEKHLCEECAYKNYDYEFDQPFSVSKLFTGLIDSMQESTMEGNELQCPNCGLTYSNFKREGKFGCSQCYEVFKSKLDPLFKGLHGHTRHKGKIPSTSNERTFLKREEDGLKTELENAVKEEEFERAAVIRDKLKDLKVKLDNYEEG